MLTCTEIFKDEAGCKWGLGETEDLCSEDLWDFFKNYVLGRDSDDLTAKYWCIGLDISLWSMLGGSMWNNHGNVYEEQVYYIKNDIQKYSKMGVLEYNE